MWTQTLIVASFYWILFEGLNKYIYHTVINQGAKDSYLQGLRFILPPIQPATYY